MRSLRCERYTDRMIFVFRIKAPGLLDNRWRNSVKMLRRLLKHRRSMVNYCGRSLAGTGCAVLGILLSGGTLESVQAQRVPVAHSAPSAPVNPPANARGVAAANVVSPVQPPDVRVEYFGAEKGYVIGGESIVLLCVVRNVGGTALPEHTLRLHCCPLYGVEYAGGDLLPSLPALGPNQSAACRWRLTATDLRTTPVAAVLIERLETGASKSGISSVMPTLQETSLTVAVVPRFAHTPGFEGGQPITDPLRRVYSVPGEAGIGNNLVAARIYSNERHEPVLALAGRDGGAWGTVAVSLPLASVRSGEEGQHPWQESFRWRDTRISATKDSAFLSLRGTLGTRWRAEITLEARRDTAVLTGHLRLTAVRTMRLVSVQLPRLLVGGEQANGDVPRTDGSPTVLAPEEPPLLSDNLSLAAEHAHGSTYGLAWTSTSPLPRATWSRLTDADGVRTTILGAQWICPDRGEVIYPGATLDFPFRLFAFSPSGTIRDALRFTMP